MEKSMFYDIMPSVIGWLGICADENGILEINFLPENQDEWPMVYKSCGEKSAKDDSADSGNAAREHVRKAICELNEYFSGERKQFTVTCCPKGTPFYREVWKALCEIPYGETRSYRHIAEAVGRPKACRAVGMANHNNPIPVIIPCHRVIGSNGNLIGYAGGTGIKKTLLELEHKFASYPEISGQSE